MPPSRPSSSTSSSSRAKTPSTHPHPTKSSLSFTSPPSHSHSHSRSHNSSGSTSPSVPSTVASKQQQQQKKSSTINTNVSPMAATVASTVEPLEKPKLHPLKHTWSVWFLHRVPGGGGGGPSQASSNTISNNNPNPNPDASGEGTETKAAATATTTTKRGGEVLGKEEYQNQMKKLGSFSSIESLFPLLLHLRPPSQLPPISDLHLFRSDIPPLWEDPSNERGGKWVCRLKRGTEDRVWEEVVMGVVGGRVGGTGTGAGLESGDALEGRELEAWNGGGEGDEIEGESISNSAANRDRERERERQREIEKERSGGLLMGGAEVCGIVLSVRRDECVLSIWNGDRREGRGREKIRDTLMQTLAPLLQRPPGSAAPLTSLIQLEYKPHPTQHHTTRQPEYSSPAAGLGSSLRPEREDESHSSFYDRPHRPSTNRQNSIGNSFRPGFDRGGDRDRVDRGGGRDDDPNHTPHRPSLRQGQSDRANSLASPSTEERTGGDKEAYRDRMRRRQSNADTTLERLAQAINASRESASNPPPSAGPEPSNESPRGGGIGRGRRDTGGGSRSAWGSGRGGLNRRDSSGTGLS